MAVNVSFVSHKDDLLKAFDSKTEKALETIGLVAEGYAKRMCPVDTGNLRNSISHAVDKSDNSAVIGTNVKYGPFVELGTSKQSAQPYLRPAAQDHASEFKYIVETIMKS